VTLPAGTMAASILFFDMAADPDLRMLMDPRNWSDIVKTVLNEDDELVGWASFQTENGEFWLSLALRPDLTGRGFGEEFVTQCVEYAASQYKSAGHSVKLHTPVFNRRAIRVYQRAGFIETKRTLSHTHNGELEFIEMEKRISR
jgi:ribosomal-protein-alanine N-acetyltransferase